MGPKVRNASLATVGNAIKVAAINASEVLHRERTAASPIMDPVAIQSLSASGHDQLLIYRRAKQTRNRHPKNKKTITSRKSVTATHGAANPKREPVRVRLRRLDRSLQRPLRTTAHIGKLCMAPRNHHRNEKSDEHTQRREFHGILTSKGRIGAKYYNRIYDRRRQHVSDRIGYGKTLPMAPDLGTTPHSHIGKTNPIAPRGRPKCVPRKEPEHQ